MVFDGFSGGGGGNYQSLSGSWTVQGHTYQKSGTTGLGVTKIKDKRWGNATYEFDLKLNNSGGDVVLYRINKNQLLELPACKDRKFRFQHQSVRQQ
ncbi:hypothetical protein GCM10010911_07370 [Paenibacillus nasutitermitis]|uniref:Uncharacterized protein n=1 Tax=Paenibacillus nasutitermitis TaxID=1652958 RepID=A0A917DNX1_9BACL|nr:hypothetical protein GCM10010911_07370 [Paenibacillus nasutitermitis]